MAESGFTDARLSVSVRSVIERSSDPVTAAGLADAVLDLHPEYGGGRGGEVRLDTAAGASAPAAVWIDLLQSAPEAAGTEIDGRRLILGLARLDQRLANELRRGGFLAALADEASERSLAIAENSSILGGLPKRGSWREEALARAAELSMLAAFLRLRTDVDGATAEKIFESIEAHLDAARRAAESSSRNLADWFAGANIQRAETNIEAAESDMLRLAPLSYVQGQLPSILTHVQQQLPKEDPRRENVEAFARRTADQTLKEYERHAVLTALRAAGAERRRGLTRVRSFRNALYVTALLGSVAAVGVAALGYFFEEALPLCFVSDTKVACPTDANPLPVSSTASGELVTASDAEVARVARRTTSPWDILLVEVVGLMGAALAASAALRNMRGTSAPYDFLVVLAALKLPAGALTAVTGLLLMRGQFVPGLSALDSSAQILAWGIVFGYAQQLFTGALDRQAFQILEDVGDVEPRAASQSAAITPEALAAAVAAVRTSLATPSLINYDGFLSVRLLDSDGQLVPVAANGSATVPVGRNKVEVTIDRVARPDGRAAQVSIHQGETADVVPFAVELDSDLFSLRSPEQDVSVPAASGAGIAEFPLQLRDGIPKASVRIRLTQHGRLIQLIALELEMGAIVQ